MLTFPTQRTGRTHCDGEDHPLSFKGALGIGGSDVSADPGLNVFDITGYNASRLPLIRKEHML